MAELDLPVDYQDLLRDFVAEGVEFLLIGGWAVAAHGHGRATDDLDVFVRPSPENAKRVIAALERFGAPLSVHGVTEGLFSQERYGYRMGRKPLLIEILTTIDGVTFDEATSDAVRVEVFRSEYSCDWACRVARKQASGWSYEGPRRCRGARERVGLVALCSTSRTNWPRSRSPRGDRSRR